MKKRTYLSDTFVILLLCCLFILTGITALFQGACVWNTARQSAEERFDYSMPLSYISGKICQSDSMVLERAEDGTAILALQTRWGDENCVTRLYCRSGGLYELFSPDSVRLELDCGQEIFEDTEIIFYEEDGMICVRCGDNVRKFNRKEGSPPKT